jgi:hypothetical protein
MGEFLEIVRGQGEGGGGGDGESPEVLRVVATVN